MPERILRMTPERELVAFLLQLHQMTHEYREGLPTLLDECRELLWFPDSEADDGPKYR